MTTEMQLPEGLKFSTMTATSQIYTNEELEIEKIYNNLDVNNNIVYIEWANKSPKGLSPKQESQKKKKNKKVFFNQITIVIIGSSIEVRFLTKLSSLLEFTSRIFFKISIVFHVSSQIFII